MNATAVSLPAPVSKVGTAVVARLFAPVDASSLAFFRIAFGGIMLWETWHFIQDDWVGLYFSGKEFYFTFWPFDFVRPWPGDGMYLHLAVMGLLAVFITLGFFYRLSAVAFFLMISYLFLLDEARYLNHLYLVCLLAFLMIFVPANRSFSLDALLRRTRMDDLSNAPSPVVPAWSCWLLRFQVAVPMFFGGIAKLNADWLQGEPLRAWLAARTDFPLIGAYFTNESVVWVMVYGALIIDLLFVAYMLDRRTRVFGFILVLLFHFMNARLFGIGIFPWLMIASTLIFFEPDWPRRAWQDIKQRHPYRLPALLVGFIAGYAIGGLLPVRFDLAQAVIGGIGVAVAAYHLDEPFRRRSDALEAGRDDPGAGPDRNLGTPSLSLTSIDFSFWQKATITFLGLWVTVQVLVPLRHLAIPGNVHWTEEGHNFSWHMKLRDKVSEGFFLVTDPATGREWIVDPREQLTSRQASKMASRPHMVLQFAHYLEERYQAEGYQDVEVRASFVSSLNGRIPQRLIDPDVDLTQVRRPWFGHAQWIMPLEEPLRASK